jgi:hypothetical protein
MRSTRTRDVSPASRFVTHEMDSHGMRFTIVRRCDMPIAGANPWHCKDFSHGGKSEYHGEHGSRVLGSRVRCIDRKGHPDGPPLAVQGAPPVFPVVPDLVSERRILAVSRAAWVAGTHQSRRASRASGGNPCTARPRTSRRYDPATNANPGAVVPRGDCRHGSGTYPGGATQAS